MAICAIALLAGGAILRARAVGDLKKEFPRRVRRPRTPLKKEVDRVLKLITSHERKIVAELPRKDNLTQKKLCDPNKHSGRRRWHAPCKGSRKRGGEIGYGVSKKVFLTKWAKR